MLSHKILHDAVKILCAATKTQGSQINEYLKKEAKHGFCRQADHTGNFNSIISKTESDTHSVVGKCALFLPFEVQFSHL